MTLKIPENINFVLEAIEKSDYEAYIVGGCVRDMILGKKPFDFDITTNALPEKIISLFEHTICTGLKHGTVTVMVDGQPVEVTTYRTEGDYSDSRHPDSVKFVSRVEDDLARRDFTVNAICYNPKTGIVDPFGGLGDIDARILRAVGEADIRFKEDALRIMRLFRFCASLGFEIEPCTLESAVSNAPLLQKVSRERIAVELKKTVNAKNPAAISPLIKSGALEFLGINRCEKLDKINKLLDNENLRLFAFLYLCSNDIMNALSCLKCSNALKDYCRTEEKLYKQFTLDSKTDIKSALRISSPDMVYDALAFRRVIFDEDTDIAERILKETIDNNEPYKISHLAVCGDDLIKLGFKGYDIGKALDRLLDLVIIHPEFNTYEILMEKIKKC